MAWIVSVGDKILIWLLSILNGKDSDCSVKRSKSAVNLHLSLFCGRTSAIILALGSKGVWKWINTERCRPPGRKNSQLSTWYFWISLFTIVWYHRHHVKYSYYEHRVWYRTCYIQGINKCIFHSRKKENIWASGLLECFCVRYISR